MASFASVRHHVWHMQAAWTKMYFVCCGQVKKTNNKINFSATPLLNDYLTIKPPVNISDITILFTPTHRVTGWYG